MVMNIRFVVYSGHMLKFYITFVLVIMTSKHLWLFQSIWHPTWVPCQCIVLPISATEIIVYGHRNSEKPISIFQKQSAKVCAFNEVQLEAKGFINITNHTCFHNSLVKCQDTGLTSIKKMYEMQTTCQVLWSKFYKSC